VVRAAAVAAAAASAKAAAVATAATAAAAVAAESAAATAAAAEHCARRAAARSAAPDASCVAGARPDECKRCTDTDSRGGPGGFKLKFNREDVLSREGSMVMAREFFKW
jgi:guanyl-specific ribonuclease Sa